MKIDPMNVEMSPFAVGKLELSPFFQDLSAIEAVIVLLFIEAVVYPTAGCAVTNGS